MKYVTIILRRLWSLFVDDGRLACALLLWCAGAAIALPRFVPSQSWDAPILLVGCILILLADIVRAARSFGSQAKADKRGE